MEHKGRLTVLWASSPEEDAMRKIILGLAAAGMVVTVTPTFAQIGVEVGPGGVGVGIGRDRDYRRDRVYEERRVYRDGDRYEGRRYGTYGSGGGCRVSVRKRLPDGTVIIRRINRC
jgi:hypothetical protein